MGIRSGSPADRITTLGHDEEYRVGAGSEERQQQNIPLEGGREVRRSRRRDATDALEFSSRPTAASTSFSGRRQRTTAKASVM